MDDYAEAVTALVQHDKKRVVGSAGAGKTPENIALHEHSTNNLLSEIPNIRHSAPCHGASRRFGRTIHECQGRPERVANFGALAGLRGESRRLTHRQG